MSTRVRLIVLDKPNLPLLLSSGMRQGFGKAVDRQLRRRRAAGMAMAVSSALLKLVCRYRPGASYGLLISKRGEPPFGYEQFTVFEDFPPDSRCGRACDAHLALRGAPAG